MDAFESDSSYESVAKNIKGGEEGLLSSFYHSLLPYCRVTAYSFPQHYLQSKPCDLLFSVPRR